MGGEVLLLKVGFMLISGVVDIVYELNDWMKIGYSYFGWMVIFFVF